MNKLFSRTHVGPAHPANTGGVTPVAPSALRSLEHAAIRDGDGNITEAELVVPRALELHENAFGRMFISNPDLPERLRDGERQSADSRRNPGPRSPPTARPSR